MKAYKTVFQQVAEELGQIQESAATFFESSDQDMTPAFLAEHNAIVRQITGVDPHRMEPGL